MKRFFAFIMILVLCALLCACSCATNTQETEQKSEPCSELTIRKLVEKNLDCYFLYYVEPLPQTTQRNSDGYLGTDKSIFGTYDELEGLVRQTYVSKKATELLEYPSKEAPLYKDVQNFIFTKPDVAEFEEYDVIWEDNYTVTITESTDTKCCFSLRTQTLDNDVYKTDGCAALENGTWLLEDLIY